MLRLQAPLDERYTAAPQSELEARIEAEEWRPRVEALQRAVRPRR